jgi:hypothetical protein
MNASPKPRDRAQLIWPAAGIAITIFAVELIAANPFYSPHIPLMIGIAAWGAALVLVLMLSAHRVGAQVGVLLAGLFLAVPCFVRTPPLFRGLLMCAMLMPFAAAAALVLGPPLVGFRARLAYLCSWCGTHQINRRTKGFDVVLLMQLMASTMILAAGIAVVMAVPDSGLWLPVRWLAGGIMALAFAEMATACFPLVATALGITVPPLMQSPWRSASVGEFWAKRWNIFASEKVFRPFCFGPLARRGIGLMLFAAFALSAVGHMLLAFITLGWWRISIVCGAFFLVQPVLIIIERQLGVRHWRLAAGRTWTLAALAVTSPLFVEPMLQVIERSWGARDSVLVATGSVLGFVIGFSSLVSLASLASCPSTTNPNTVLSSLPHQIKNPPA